MSNAELFFHDALIDEVGLIRRLAPGIELFSGTLATAVAGAIEAAAGLQEAASIGLGIVATALRAGATGEVTSVISFALPQVILDANRLGYISSLGKLTTSAADVRYDNPLLNNAPQSSCPG